VAASLLQAIGLPELVMHSLDEYEALAGALARDPARLGAIKAKLARNRDTEPMFDTARFTRYLESAYTTMWERQQAGLPPEAFRGFLRMSTEGLVNAAKAHFDAGGSTRHCAFWMPLLLRSRVHRSSGTIAATVLAVSRQFHRADESFSRALALAPDFLSALLYRAQALNAARSALSRRRRDLKPRSPAIRTCRLRAGAV
jgi:hypothetical protein